MVQNWISENKIDVLEWPAHSPDLNPIEHLWGDVQIGVFKNKSGNVQQLWASVRSAYISILIERYRSLLDSMSRHCPAVIASNGF